MYYEVTKAMNTGGTLYEADLMSLQLISHVGFIIDRSTLCP